MVVVNSRGVPCPPYESVYREQAGGGSGWLLAQVEREYEAAGLAPSPDLGELPDHVAVEIEFMAVLSGWEAQAWEEENLAQGIDALRRQKAFLDSHLALWFPTFARQVMATDSGGTYAPVCEGAQAFMGYDSDMLGALLERTPAMAEAP
jgi:TorA maturation chaperone TorD